MLSKYAETQKSIIQILFRRILYADKQSIPLIIILLFADLYKPVLQPNNYIIFCIKIHILKKYFISTLLIGLIFT